MANVLVAMKFQPSVITSVPMPTLTHAQSDVRRSFDAEIAKLQEKWQQLDDKDEKLNEGCKRCAGKPKFCKMCLRKVVRVRRERDIDITPKITVLTALVALYNSDDKPRKRRKTVRFVERE